MADAVVTEDQAVFSLEDYVPMRLAVTSMNVSEMIASAYQERFGLTIPEWRLIVSLARHGPVAPSLISRGTDMDKVTVSRSAKSLVGRGLAVRVPNRSDSRSHQLKLTTAGSRLFAEIAPIARQYEARLLQELSGDEIIQFKSMLERLRTRAKLIIAEAKRDAG